ncbi:MAG: hypothetical protein RSF90_05465, partial [Pygmaiobacter sp.]
AISVFVMLLFATFFIGFIVMLSRFSKNIYGDEGYLMNTLPVSPAQNIMAKTLCSAIITIVSLLVCALTGFIFFFGDYLPEVGESLSRVWFEFMTEILPFLTTMNRLTIVVIFVEVLVIMLTSLLVSPLMMYTCISLGQKMPRHKNMGAFASYLAISFALQMFSSFTFFVFGNLVDLNAFQAFTYAQPALFTALIFGILLATELVLGAIYFFVTNALLTRSLNLE